MKTTGDRLDRVRCGYCNRRASTVENDGPARVPVCRGHVEVRRVVG